MPCAPGRISSNSRQPGQRSGSLLSKRYFDPKTHKVYPGAPALFRNTEQRRLVVSLVTLEIDPWKFLAPLSLQSQDSEAQDGALESSSPPLAIYFEPGLRSEQKIDPSNCEGSIISCSSSGGNVPGLPCNSNKLTKSEMDSSSSSSVSNNFRVSDCDGSALASSDILVDSIPEADRPVNRMSRKKRKKKGKHHNKSMAKTVSIVLATQCEESISDSSVCGTSLSTDTVSASELNLENTMPENFSSCSLAVHHITAEQDQSQMCKAPYSTKINKRTTCFSESSACEEGNCNRLDRSLVSNHRAIVSSSPESREIVQAVCDDKDTFCEDTFCSTSETSGDKDGVECITCCSSNHIWQKDSCDTLYNTERAGNSSQASSSDGFQPVINRKRNWLNKRASQNLNGIHRFGAHNMHDMIGKERVHKNDMNTYVSEEKRLNLVSRHVGISSKYSEGKDRLNTSIGFNKNGRNSGVQSQTAMLRASVNYSDSIEVRPKGTYREYKVPEMLNRKQYSDALQGNNTATEISHTGSTIMDRPSKDYVPQKGMGTSSQLTHHQCTGIGIDSSFGSDFQNDVAMPTENAVSCQSGPCETQVIVEEDIASEGTHSTMTDTSEGTPSTVTDTSEGTPSTVIDTSEGTPSIVSDTSDVAEKQISPSELMPIILNDKHIRDHCDSKMDVIGDLCLADSADRKYMKAESENSHENNNELDNASLPAEKNDSLAPDIGGTGSLAAVVDESIPTSLKSKNEDALPISSSHQFPHANVEYHDIPEASNSCLMHEVKDECFSGFKTDLDKIVRVADDSYRLQAISESVRLVTGSPVAEFEKFVLSATPILDKLSCRTCSPNQFIGDSFCGHQIPNIPLRSLWQWYEKLGSYGMEVKAGDYDSLHKSRDGGFGFRAYFVPYLSAIQLFGRCRTSARSNSYSNKEVREDGASDEGSNQWSRSTHQDDGELLFEYFESDLPHQRRPLLEKIKQLIRGDTSSKSKPFGDPLNLEHLNLHDLHPASWYSVAWYPIYRIPDGNFRATFLTYYSLGNFVRVTSERPGCSDRLVSPVVGLQTYNTKGECWFEPTVAKTKSLDPSEIMEGRIRMLEQAAFVMARATVRKGNERSVNRHPDFEFFLTRRW